MLNITHYQRNANQNHNEVPSHAGQNDFYYVKFKNKIKLKKKKEIELPYHPAIPLLGIHTEETRRERDTCTPMIIEALFIIARTWKQPRCPSADEWIRKLWYILHNGVLLSH